MNCMNIIETNTHFYTEKPKMTTLFKAAYNKYKKSNMFSLNEAYKRPSYAKRAAWAYVEETLKDDFINCEPLKIIFNGCQSFSVGTIGTLKSNNKRYFVYFTRYNNYIVNLD